MRLDPTTPSASSASTALAVFPFITPRHPFGSAQPAPGGEGADPEVDKVMAQVRGWAPDFRFTGVAGMVEPSLVSPSRWAVRCGDLFRHVGAGELEAEMRETGGNIVPIVVRPCPPERVHHEFPEAKFEVVSGLKRLMASIRLGLEVFVVVVDLTDEAAARVIVHSNRSGVAPRPYEWGGLYSQLLVDGVFKRQNALAAALSVQPSEVSNSLALRHLNPVVLGAFRSPLELHYADAPTLKHAWEDDPEKMTQRAIKAVSLRGQLDRLAVLALLLNDEKTAESKTQSTKTDVPVVVENILVAVISTTVKGLTTVKLKRKNLPAATIETLRTALEELGRSAQGISLVPRE